MKQIHILFLLLCTVPVSVIAQEDKALYQSIWGKNRKHFNLSLPFVNYILQSPPGMVYEQTGILGLTVGGNYCHSDKRFTSFQMGIANAALPVEWGTDSLGWKYGESAFSFFVNARHNHIIKRVEIGYGPLLSYHDFGKGKRNEQLGIDSSMSYRNLGAGLSLSIYFRVVYFMYAGILYQPHLFSLTTSSFKYEHLLSMDIMFRIPVRNKNSREN